MNGARDGRPAPAGRLEGGEAAALAALAFLLLVAVLWWTLALWPPPAGLPSWVQTARAVCFGAHDGELPDAGGWILLVGEPLGMAAALYAIARRPLASGLRRVARGWPGRAVLGSAALLLLSGAGAAASRVHGATTAPHGAAALLRPVDRPAPALGLVDQRGEVLTLERLRGRPALVTFAFAHCQTVCPLLVHDALRVQRERPGVGLVVVTLDPWRDTPARLPAIARSWGLGGGAHLLSGEIPEVEAVLRAWGAAGVRDPRTGEVGHAPTTLVLDAEGRIRFVTRGRPDELRAALSAIPTAPVPRHR